MIIRASLHAVNSRMRVSCFAQTGTSLRVQAFGRWGRCHGGWQMSESDQFRQYAEEAMRWVAQSKTEEEKQLLIELLCTWTAAAVAAEAIASPVAKPPEHAGR